MIYAEKNYNDLTKKTAELIKMAGLSPTIVFCEDKITLSLEREVAKLCGGSLFCEITTLNRFLNRLVKNKQVCSKQTTSLIIKKILCEQNLNLTTFKNVNSYSLPGAIAELIAQLKSAKVTPKALADSAQNFDGLFKYKVQDLSLIYQKYEEYLMQNDLLDTNNKFSLFVPLLKDFDLENYNVLVVGFQSVTAQTAELFKTLNDRAKSLDFVLLYGQENLFVNETFNFATSLNHKATYAENINHIRYFLLDNLYNPSKKVAPYNDKVAIFSYNTPFDEIEDIAKEIKTKILNGEQYQDFMLISPDLAKTKTFIQKTFTSYEIPYFIEDNFNLSTHPLIKAITSFIDLRYTRFSINNYKKVLRQTTLFSQKTFINEFIDFITANAYSSSAILKGITETDSLAQEYESFRKFTFSLPNFYPQDSAQNYVSKVLELLEKTSCIDNLENIKENLIKENKLELAEFVTAGYDYIINILQEIAFVLGEEQITAREFKALILSGATYTELSVIPQGGDRVYVGDFNACKYRFCKNLYVTGLTSEVPNSTADTSLLNDADLKRLDKIKIVIEPKISIVNARHKENVCVALSNFTNKLVLSYSQTDMLGKEQLPSEIIKETLLCFSSEQNPLQVVKKSYLNLYKQLHGTPQEILLEQAKKYLSPREAIKNFATELSNYKYAKGLDDTFPSFYEATKNLPLLNQIALDLTNRANATLNYTVLGSGELFFPDKKVSASCIESYYSCPYANFLKYGLGIQEKQEGVFKSNEIGSFLHSVLENFITQFNGEADLAKLDEVVNQLIEPLLKQDIYQKYTKKAEYENLFNLLKKETKALLKRFILEKQSSSFSPKHVEYAFGFNDKIKGVKIKTKLGDYEVKGKIDRVDFADNYVRIIDYKSGGTDGFEDDSNLFTGKKLQLYLYLNLFLDKNYIPAGVYYAPINNEQIKNGALPIKSFKGKTLDDTHVLSLTDKNYLQGSQIIDADLNKKGELKIKNTISQDRLTAFCKYARRITASAIEQIKGDYAVISPMGKACEYCNFYGVCGFQKETYSTERSLPNITGETLQTIAEEENE